jgi:hypothetical protein
MIHRNPFKLVVKLDSRLEGISKYILADEDEETMRIPDETMDCCCFIYYSVAGVHKLAGTGFFIGENPPEDGLEHLRWVDLVTAKHVIENVKNKVPKATLGMRVNVAGADTVDIDIPDNAWLYHPTDKSVDAVIAHINGIQGLEVKALPTEIVMNDEIIRKHGIG